MLRCVCYRAFCKAAMVVINGVELGGHASRHFLTNYQKLHRGIWPWTVGLKSRLPMHYKRRYIERFMRDPAPVHYQPDPRDYTADEFGIPTRVQNIPIPVFFPKESNDMLWGGEGIIAGFYRKHKKQKLPMAPRLWMPRLSSRVFYSEVCFANLDLLNLLRTDITIFLKYETSSWYQRLNSSSSHVLMVISLSYGKAKNSTPTQLITSARWPLVQNFM